MENVVLVIHLILALGLIGVVLLQRSEGGGLGMGGGGGGGANAGRPAASPLGRVTWILAIAFIATSIALTIIAAEQSSDGSVVDGNDLLAPAAEPGGATLPDLGGGSLLPPSAATGGAVVPDLAPIAPESAPEAGAASEVEPEATVEIEAVPGDEVETAPSGN